MLTQPFLWILIVPIICAPLVYLLGRLFTRSNQDPEQGSPAAGLALMALLITWVPLVSTIQHFVQQGPATVMLGDIPLRFDGLSLLLAITAVGLGTFVVIFSGPAMRGKSGEEKYYAMLLTMIGVMVALGCTADLFNLWVWFEAMAISSYLLVIFNHDQPASLEAGVKYVVQSAVGSTMVLFGIALVLLLTGTMNFNEIADGLQGDPATIVIAAGALFIIGFGVKAALVPMHTWLPDAHSQAPSGISAMLSGVVIEAGLVAMLRALGPLTAVVPAATWGAFLIGFGALNMLVGNLMALRQVQVKRLLAYSSLSHVGYMIFGLGAALVGGSPAGAQGGMFHLFNHGIMKGLAFLAAGALLYTLHEANVKHTGAHSTEHAPLLVSDLDGTARRYPLVALAFSMAVLGLGGLPPLAGFMSKWQIFVAGFSVPGVLVAGLVVFAALNSVLSLAYYAPLVNGMYRKQPSAAMQAGADLPKPMLVPLALLSVLVLAFGLWPALAEWLTLPAGQAILATFRLITGAN